MVTKYAIGVGTIKSGLNLTGGFISVDEAHEYAAVHMMGATYEVIPYKEWNPNVSEQETASNGVDQFEAGITSNLG